MDNWCEICMSDLDPETGLCTNQNCPNSIPDPQFVSPIEEEI